jgi:DNA-binding CsgD family transcriptional regulator
MTKKKVSDEERRERMKRRGANTIMSPYLQDDRIEFYCHLPGRFYAPHLTHHDVDIRVALDDRDWPRARNCIQDTVRNNIRLHAETWLLVAEKLVEDDRTPRKRSRGQPATFEKLVERLSIGEKIDNFIAASNEPYLYALAEAAKRAGISEHTASNYRARWNKFRDETDDQ